MASTLSWTKYGPLDEETSLLDPLAFDYFAQVLGNIVLPSFTTRTSRARYYSMVCYGIYISNEFLKRKGKVYYEKDILDAFILYERFWARAVVEHYKGNLNERDGKEREFRGKRGALREYFEKTGSLNYRFLTRQLELGGLGAYRSSLEDLELVKENLSLTHKGMKLAKLFVNTITYDELVLRAMKEEKIINKEGRGSLQSFGSHAILDGFISESKTFLQNHQEEIGHLAEYILDNPKNKVTVTFIYENQHAGNSMAIIKQITDQQAQTDIGKKIMSGFKTILAFEELAIIMNRIWCSIIRTAEKSLGRPTIAEAVHGSREYLDQLIKGRYITRLTKQPDYKEIVCRFHGSSFDPFIIEFQLMTEHDYDAFLIALIKYHINVMKRRNSGPWMLLDGGEIIGITGYDYPKKTEKSEFLHDYKVHNILTLIKDTGWVPGDEVY